MHLLIFTLILVALFYVLPFSSEINYQFMDRSFTSILKGLAILLVVLSHMAGKFGIRYFTPFGGIGVAIFLICSAYGLASSFEKNRLHNYWTKKIIKVWFPYALLQTIYFLFQIITGNNINFVSYLMDITLLKTTHPFGWYLQILFVWYIIFYLINLLFNKPKFKIFFLLLISIGFIFIPNELWAEQSLSFITGIFIYKLTADMNTKRVTNNQLLPWILLILGFIFLIIKQTDFVRNFEPIYYNIIQLLIKLPISIGMIFLATQFKYFFKNITFLYLGKYSFEVYLIHAYTISFLENPSYFKIIAFIITTAILVLIYHKLVEKTTNLFYKKSKMKLL